MERTAADEAQYIKMTQTPIPKLIGGLAIPTIISMLISSIYNMADTYFVSKLGTSATGAVGIVFSLMAIIQAVGFTLGMGSGSLSSRMLGQQRKKDAEEVAATAFCTAVIFGILLAISGLFFLDKLMVLLGATETILPYAKAYAQYILYGAPFMCASFVMNNLLRSQGRAVLSMIGIGFGGILNMVLDPIFIFVFDLGIAGAAIATVLSQCVSFSILFYFMFFSKQTTLKIHVKKMARDISVYTLILKTGAPSFFRQALASTASIVLNTNAAVYGDAAVAAMSIVSRLTMFIFSFMMGLGQGFQPVAGYNYGAGKYKRVKEAFWFTVKTGFVVLGSLAVIGFLFAPNLIGLFRKEDAQVIAIGALALRAQCISMPLNPFYMTSNMLFQTTGHSGKATFLAMARQGLFFIPFMLTLPNIIGLLGVQISQASADAASFFVAVFFAIRFFKELNQKIVEQEATLALENK